MTPVLPSEISQHLTEIIAGIRERVGELRSDFSGEHTWFGWNTEDAAAVADGIDALLSDYRRAIEQVGQLETQVTKMQEALTQSARECRRLEKALNAEWSPH